jgi:hypothetical protein
MDMMIEKNREVLGTVVQSTTRCERRSGVARFGKVLEVVGNWPTPLNRVDDFLAAGIEEVDISVNHPEFLLHTPRLLHAIAHLDLSSEPYRSLAIIRRRSAIRTACWTPTLLR